MRTIFGLKSLTAWCVGGWLTAVTAPRRLAGRVCTAVGTRLACYDCKSACKVFFLSAAVL